MAQMPDQPDERASTAADPDDAVSPAELQEQADDPSSGKRTTGEAQAEQNRELDPPA